MPCLVEIDVDRAATFSRQAAGTSETSVNFFYMLRFHILHDSHAVKLSSLANMVM